MMFKEFRETEDFKLADVISFVGTEGEELDIDNPYSEDLDSFDVEDWHKDNGYLEIVLN